MYDRPCGGYEVGRGGGGGRVGREVSCEVCHDPGGGPASRGRFWSGPTSIITIHRLSSDHSIRGHGRRSSAAASYRFSANRDVGSSMGDHLRRRVGQADVLIM